MTNSPGETIEALHDVATRLQSQNTTEGVCDLTVSAASDILDFNLWVVSQSPLEFSSNWLP